MPAFFRALAKEGGQIDRAMGVARDRAANADCDDYWMPALFMRLRTGRLWYVPGLSSGTSGQTESKTFADAVAANKHAAKKIAEKVKKGYVEVK